ncbi:MAG: tRNA pseudouridine(55) synthase TruB [Flavobacteriales bacterium]
MSFPAPNSFTSLEELAQGCLLLIDKPLGYTSFDVLNRIKGFVRNNFSIAPNEHGHEQRFKIGHAGTLDPLATGLLVVCTGKYTKRIDEFQGGEKEYTGIITFGQTTPSYDLETTPEGNYPTAHITRESLEQAAMTFVGEIWQKPPIYSAKQVDGKRAYHAARKGQTIIMAAVPIVVDAFEITSFDLPHAAFRIRCSKGTYIRSIAHDVGQKLDSGSHLSELRRTRSRPFDVTDALTLPQLMEKLQQMTTLPLQP